MNHIVQDWKTKSLREFKKEYDMKEFMWRGLVGNTKYYSDYYGNSYQWYVEKQKDGFFHGYITKQKTTSYKRKVKRVLITLLAMKCQESDKRYLIAKAKRDAKKPPPKTKQELKTMDIINKIRAIDRNNKKHTTDIKRSSTWIKKNNKKRKLLEKRLNKYKEITAWGKTL